jgi:hypothetical protein
LLVRLSCDPKHPGPAFNPKPLGDLKWLNIEVVPPRDLVPGLMQLTMVFAAERHCELIAHFETQRAGLCKLQVVRV